MSESRGVKGIYIIAALVVFVASLGIVLFTMAKRRSARETCALNLKLLGMTVGEASPSSDKFWDDVPTGSAFWLNPQKWPLTQTRLVRQQMVLCPVIGPTKKRAGGCDYRGPAKSLRLLHPTDPMGADKPGNHGPGRGGYVLLRNGELFDCTESDPLWTKSAETTRE